MTRTIRVEQEHIEKALKLCKDERSQRESCCPVALALHEQGFPGAYVCEEEIQLNPTKGRWMRLPDTVLTFVKLFDTNHRVKPFSFTINT